MGKKYKQNYIIGCFFDKSIKLTNICINHLWNLEFAYNQKNVQNWRMHKYGRNAFDRIIKCGLLYIVLCKLGSNLFVDKLSLQNVKAESDYYIISGVWPNKEELFGCLVGGLLYTNISCCQ